MTGPNRTPSHEMSGAKPAGSLIARNSVLNLIAQGAPILVGLVAIPVTLRGLGTERFGFLSFAWVVLAYFNMLELGLGTATTKFAAEFIATGRQRDLRHLIWTSLLVVASMGLLGGLVLAALTPTLISTLNVSSALASDGRSVFLTLSLCVPLTFVASVFKGTLAAFHRFDLINLIELPSGAAYYAIPAVAVLLGAGLPAIVLSLMASRVAAAIAYFFLSCRLVPDLRVPSLGRKEMLVRTLKFGLWNSLSGFAQPVAVYADRLLIGSLLSMKEVAYYTAPSAIAGRLWIIPASIAGALFPAFASLGALRDEGANQDLLARSTRLLLSITAPLTLIVVFFSRDLLSVWLGPEFAEHSTLVCQILAIGQIVDALAYLASTMISALGRPDIPALLAAIELPFYALGAWFLIGNFGIAGAAVGASLRLAFNCALLWLAISRITRVRAWSVVSGSLRTILAVLLLAGSMVALAPAHLHPVSRALVAVALLLLFAAVTWRYALDDRDRSGFAATYGRLVALGGIRPSGRS